MVPHIADNAGSGGSAWLVYPGERRQSGGKGDVQPEMGLDATWAMWYYQLCAWRKCAGAGWAYHPERTWTTEEWETAKQRKRECAGHGEMLLPTGGSGASWSRSSWPLSKNKTRVVRLEIAS